MGAQGEHEFDELSDSLAARVKPELHPDERLIWAVQVEPRPHAGSINPLTQFVWGLIFLGAGSGALALYRSLSDARKADAQGVLIGLIICGFVIGAILLAFAGDNWRSRRRLKRLGVRSTYALTDRRAILWNPQQWPVSAVKAGAITVRSIPRGSIKTVYRIEYPDGSGDVVMGGSNEEGVPEATFEGIAEVRRVEDLARRTLLGPEKS